MNALEHLNERFAARFPDGCVATYKPETETGRWWLDAELQGHLVVVEWRADRGFGITTPTRDDFGTKPHEVYETAEAAYDRVVARPWAAS